MAGKKVKALDEKLAELRAEVEAEVEASEPGAAKARLELAAKALEDAHAALVERNAEVAAAKRQAESLEADAVKLAEGSVGGVADGPQDAPVEAEPEPEDEPEAEPAKEEPKAKAEK
jgi:hypothetical protein